MAKTLAMVKAVVKAPTAHRIFVKAGVENSLPYKKRMDSLMAYIVTARIVNPARETYELSVHRLSGEMLARPTLPIRGPSAGFSVISCLPMPYLMTEMP